jgi:hypothetical protein
LFLKGYHVEVELMSGLAKIHNAGDDCRYDEKAEYENDYIKNGNVLSADDVVCSIMVGV